MPDPERAWEEKVGLTVGGGLGRPLGPGFPDILDIIVSKSAAAAVAATQGYAAASSPSFVASSPLARVLSLLKLLHLRFIYRVSTDAEIPPIWLKVCGAPTKAAALAVISQYLWAGREVCRIYFFGSADMLHVCRSLFMFMRWDRFVHT